MLDEKLNLYEKTFGDFFPTFMFMHLTEEEMCKVIDSCLDEDKDVYTMGFLKDDYDMKY